MAEEKKVILTREGYQKLEQELNYYISVRRNEISEQIAIARGFGDLSENAEYDEAKNEQSRIEAKIVEMENTLRNCIVVEDDEVTTETVGVGNTVKVDNLTLLSTAVETPFTWLTMAIFESLSINFLAYSPNILPAFTLSVATVRSCNSSFV